MSNLILQDDAWIKIAHEGYEAQRMRKHYERLEDACIEKLKELSMGKSSMGSIYRFVLHERKGTIDYLAIPELKAIDLELYRKPSGVMWKLTNDNIIL